MNKRNFYSIRICLILIMIFLVVGICGAQNNEKIPDNEIWLIIRGDDIGFSHGANMGFVKSFQEGILSSAEIMVPPSWFNEGVNILKENPEIEAGVHLTLTSEWMNYRWGPVGPIKNNSTIIDKDGYFYHRTEKNSVFDKIFDSNYCIARAKIDLEEVRIELKAQIEKAIEKIPWINHTSCHMGAAVATPELKHMVEELVKEYGLVPDWKFREISKEISLWSVPAEEKIDSLIYYLNQMEPGRLYYLVVHPGINTPEMKAINSPAFEADKHMAEHRAAITEALTNKKVRNVIEKRNIKIITHQYVIDKGLLNN